MIDYTETYGRDGSVTAKLVAADLATGFRYTIKRFPNESGVNSTSKANGNGSIRHHWFATYDEALAHGIKWAKRKIAEARRQAVNEAAPRSIWHLI